MNRITKLLNKNPKTMLQALEKMFWISSYIAALVWLSREIAEKGIW